MYPFSTLRFGLLTINRFVSKLLISLIRIYQFGLSMLFGNCCRFDPSCSAYALTAIEKRGWWQGCWLTLKRLLRCHPWCAGGLDPVPEKFMDNK